MDETHSVDPLCVNPTMLTWLAERAWRELNLWVGGDSTDAPARPSVLLGNSLYVSLVSSFSSRSSPHYWPIYYCDDSIQDKMGVIWHKLPQLPLLIIFQPIQVCINLHLPSSWLRARNGFSVCSSLLCPQPSPCHALLQAPCFVVSFLPVLNHAPAGANL